MYRFVLKCSVEATMTPGPGSFAQSNAVPKPVPAPQPNASQCSKRNRANRNILFSALAMAINEW